MSTSALSILRWAAALVAAAFGVAQPAAAARVPNDRLEQVLRSMEAASGQPVRVARSRLTGLATFVSTAPGHPIRLAQRGPATPEERAFAFLATYGEAFGVKDRAQARVERILPDSLGMQHVRLRQHKDGVPVTGGELIVHLRGDELVAINGKTLPRLERLDTRPTLVQVEALRLVRDFLAEKRGVRDVTLSQPRLEIFNRGLLEGSPYPTRLAWFVEARRAGYRQFVWIDARRGDVLLDFSQLPDALVRQVYTAGGSYVLPGTLVRSDTINPPGPGATGDPDADKAYQYAGDTYNYYLTEHGRDSYDNAGAPLISTVHYCDTFPACPWANASWDGTQMVYGEGFSLADDVDAHELTHAVTEQTANLFYYMQSGALNESFSDVFGESVDLWNNSTEPEPPGDKWLLGEGLPGGAGRNMMDPNPYGDPGKMSDNALFVCEDPGFDGGGVHTNSGVPNHAYALMVDGGTYNGVTITGIGLTKAGKIQYRALTAYLNSASDFLDDYNSLKQSCTDLIGTAGITAADCTEAGKALDAVEMASTWPCAPSQAAVPALCPAGQSPVDVFHDNLENPSSGKWTSAVLTGINHWDFGVGTPPADVYWPSFATSGVYSFWGYDFEFLGDSVVSMTTPITIPTGARMQFNHSYGFDNDSFGFYDGGVIEYSTNGGSTWTDAGGLVSAGASYGGTLCTGPECAPTPNPLAGRSAFVGDSWGYTASQLNLASLAGQNVLFRFRIGADDIYDDYGWFIDDVKVYTCVATNVTIDDRSVSEGNSGQTAAAFTLHLSGVSSATVTVNWATADGTATAGSDYASSNGTATFTPGQVTQTISVPVIGDTTPEPNETFLVNLTGATNATIADSQALGTILDDDASDFFTLTPCRVFDTRELSGPTGGVPITCGTDRSFTIVGPTCGVPASAKAVSLNLTATAPTAGGNLRLFASAAEVPPVSSLNYAAGQTRANNAVAPLGAGGQIAIRCMPSGTTHVVVDVNGYFQ